jgi:transposase
VRALRGDGGGANQSPSTTQGLPLKNAKERMDVIAAYRDVGTYRGAAALCGTTHKTVRRIIEAHEAASDGAVVPVSEPRSRNYDEVADLVAEKVAKTFGKISAKRLLPTARAAGYEGSDRNFRRLVAEEKRSWRQGQVRAGGRRPAVWSPGEVLAIDWGEEIVAGRKVHVFCAVLAWSRFRFVRFAADEQQSATLGMLAECFEVLGGVPKVVLADRMGCLKGGVVANVVVAAPDYVRFATHYRFRPDFCHAADPESKGIVENLVGYAKDDLLVPLELDDDPWAGGLAGLNERAVAHRRPLERPRRRSRAQTTSRQRQRWPRRLLALSPRSRTATSSPDPLHQRCDPARRIVPPEEPHQLKQRRVGTFSWPPQLGR